MAHWVERGQLKRLVNLVVHSAAFFPCLQSGEDVHAILTLRAKDSRSQAVCMIIMMLRSSKLKSF